jgi:membrane protein implicated in regulation of membrane protease activity
MVSSGVSLVYMLKDIKKRIEQGLLYSALSFSYAFLEQKNIFIIFAVLSLLFLFVLYNAYKRYKENKEVLVY